MFTNLASYIWGGEEETPADSATPPCSPDKKKSPASSPIREEDGWVLVGDSSNLNLGSLNDQGSLPPPADSSANTSVVPSEIDEEETPRITRTTRRLISPFSQSTATTVSQMKGIRSAQSAMQKRTHKNVSAKNMERKNKAVKMSNNCKKHALKLNHPVKSAGMNKQLKQC